jgi:hypothetical protein
MEYFNLIKNFLQEYLSYLKEYPNSFKLIDGIIICVIGIVIGYFIKKHDKKQVTPVLNIHNNNNINISQKIEVLLDNAIPKPKTMEEPNKKPNPSPYFDDQKFLRYLNKEELDRFKNWVMNNNDFHDEIDKWYKALSFYISETAIDKATNNEITITSNEYVSYLVIKYFSVYQKEKEMKNLTLYYNKDKNKWWSQFPNEPNKEAYDEKIYLEKIEKEEDTDFKKHTTLWKDIKTDETLWKDIKTGEIWICGVINFSSERWEQYKGNIETLQELKAEALEKAIIDTFNKPKPPNQPH